MIMIVLVVYNKSMRELQEACRQHQQTTKLYNNKLLLLSCVCGDTDTWLQFSLRLMFPPYYYYHNITGRNIGNMLR